MTAYDDPAFREKMKQEYRYQTVNALLSRYKNVQPQQSAPAAPSWTLDKPVPPAPTVPPAAGIGQTQAEPPAKPRLRGWRFPTRIDWKTEADWEAYRAKLVDVSELQTYFEWKKSDESLRQDVRVTANMSAKNIADYHKKALCIKAPKNGADEDDILDVLDDIRKIIEQKLVKVATACRKGMSYQTTASDRNFYHSALSRIEKYLNSICFYKRRIMLSHLTEEEEALLDPSDISTSDPARIGRYSDLLFPPYQARYGDDEDDIYTIAGRCTYWTAGEKRGNRA